MPVVEIHIKDNEVQKISGNNAYVFVHDHDINETTPMVFKKQEEIYDSTKNTRHSINETIQSSEK